MLGVIQVQAAEHFSKHVGDDSASVENVFVWHEEWV